ncbi:MAG: LEA type 2 family protein [Bacteroidales bacterium]|nr:LEA type 2 family protein [Bacteroidales bacterium]
MSKIKRAFIILCIALGLSSCETLTQVATQAAQMYNLTNCTFNFNSVNQIKMLDVNLSKGMTKSDLNVTQLLNLTNAIMRKSLPVSFNVNLDVNNPNSIAAAMTKMDYILTLNGKEVISTTMNNGVNVPANSTGNISIPISTDLFQLFSGETADAIVNLAFKLAGASSEPVNVGLKVKPYISINGQQLAYPNYINLNKTLQ